VFLLSLPTLNFNAYPKVFITIFRHVLPTFFLRMLAETQIFLGPNQSLLDTTNNNVLHNHLSITIRKKKHD